MTPFKLILITLALCTGSMVAERHRAASAAPWFYDNNSHCEAPQYYYDQVPKPWYKFSELPHWVFSNGCFYYFDGRSWSLGRCY